MAKELSALLNLEGGHLLLGVEDDGQISGLSRSRGDAELWIMNIARQSIQPAIIPTWQPVDFDDGRIVGVIGLPADGPSKPYKAKRGSAWITFVRVGSSSREATREEEARLYQASRMVRFDIMPIADTSVTGLDFQRVQNYFRDVLKRETPPSTNEDAWEQLLVNTDILAPLGEGVVATASGLLLFGVTPNRRLPQAGVTAAAFPGTEKDYGTVDEEVIRGPLVSLLTKRGRVVEKGVIDRTVDFVARNMGTAAWLESGRRRRKRAFPLDAVREAVVNAVAHRDYSLSATDIEVSLYSDRVEIISPGRLPNGVTVEKMRDGLRAARNELLKEILRDYGYVEHLGMGVRNRIIQSMHTHNGTEPDLVEEETRFVVRLWKKRDGNVLQT
ncbi:MAG: ATP-binding protein [Candidatus Eiseniibacteriota bacterium]